MADKETHTSKKKQARLEKIQKKALESQRIRVHNQVLAYQKKHKKERKIAPRDSFISLQHINKIYDNHVQAVFDFNLEIKQHEFIVFVGPSGCGKSTTLRMIAGLESITSGDLYIDKVYSNDIESKNRDIAMVFQSYALYPNLSVAGNMAFGLKIRKVPTMLLDEDGKPVKKINKSVINDYKRELYSLEQYINECKEEEKPAIQKDIDELKETVEYLEKTPIPVYVQKHLDKEVIAKRVDEALEILQIKEYADRKPKALSGGQCQRVALGRAIVRKSKVFLMDEPLSNLDAKLRVQMRSEIVKLHKKLNATTIYVTHDQTEAMTMASRIVVMSKGVVQQVGTPLEIYNHPANLFVATFIGSPSMNLYNGQFEGESFTFRKEDDLTEESVKMPAEFGKRVKEFYKNELVSYKQEKEQILASFVERNDLLAKIEADQNIQDEAKREAAIAQHKAELEAVIKSNSRLSFLEEAIEKYEEYCASNKYETVFGIRPEDIYDKSAKTTHVEAGAIIKGKITVSELLGHEYFIHLDFEGKDLVSKISSKQIIDSGEYIELVLDLQRSHIFDRVSGKLIY